MLAEKGNNMEFEIKSYAHFSNMVRIANQRMDAISKGLYKPECTKCNDLHVILDYEYGINKCHTCDCPGALKTFYQITDSRGNEIKDKNPLMGIKFPNGEILIT